MWSKSWLEDEEKELFQKLRVNYRVPRRNRDDWKFNEPHWGKWVKWRQNKGSERKGLI